MNAPFEKMPRVLVADDDEINLMLLREAIEGAGCEVTTVVDGAAALREASSGQYDVVLLDVAMPRLDGYSVCRALRSAPITSRLPVIMITSRDDAASIDRAYDAGATDFISKPVNWALIPRRLRYVLRSAESETRVRDLAYFDPVTGLPNRQSALRFVAEGLAGDDDRAPSRGLAVVSLALHGVGRIGGNFGSVASDGVLRVVGHGLARLLQSKAGDRALVEFARVGDVEFIASICGSEPEALAVELAEAMTGWLREPVNFEEHEFFLECGLGVAVFPQHGADAETLLSRAAAARDDAMVAGQGVCPVYSEEVGARSRERLALDVELRRAVRNEELELHFQPKICLASGKLAGVEALLRWYHSERGDVSPATFIPLAEESGLILEIDAWVIRAACRQLRNWRDAGLATSIAVNVSGKHFALGDPVATIAREVAATGISAADLTVEVTESVLVRDMSRARGQLQRLRALGCKVAIDDFGTGYSSLAYLGRLPADEVKIDRAFIQNVHRNETDALIVQAIIGLLRGLGQRVTAEGVENRAQLDWLQANGCTEVQGYLTGRAVRAHDIARRFADGSPAQDDEVATRA